MDEVERTRLSATVFGDVARLVHGTALEVAAILHRDGLNPAQLQLLLAVRRNPGTVQHALSAQLGTTPANVSMLISRLADAGHVRREPDGAANRLWLTARGSELAERLGPEHDAYMAGLFRALNDIELRTLANLVHRACEP